MVENYFKDLDENSNENVQSFLEPISTQNLDNFRELNINPNENVQNNIEDHPDENSIENVQNGNINYFTSLQDFDYEDNIDNQNKIK